ncbi:ATP-binding protein [Pseudomonas alabamensis]|uniref:ATP-binding protein n=1 Tax=Pseudomonas alabamensis TaxID=3064349 RepID=UPI0016433386
MDGSTAFVPRVFSGTTKITDKGIRNHFSKTVTPWRPLAELIWNGFDARATCVTAKVNRNPLGGVESITVLDNGDGIETEGNDSSFFKFRDSKKKRSHDVHGEKGIGRLYFHKICNRADWFTRSSGTDSKLTVFSSALNKVDAQTIPTNSQHALLSNLPSGTCVELTEFSAPYLDDNTLAKYLSLEFGWYLAINPDKTIVLNSKPIQPPPHSTEEITFPIEDYQFDVKLIQWSEKPTSGKSYIYYSSFNGKIVSNLLSSLNKKTDYYTTLAARSSWFDACEAENDSLRIPFDTLSQSKIWKTLHKSIYEFGQEHYKNFLILKADEQLNKLEQNGELPSYAHQNKGYAEWRLSNLKDILRVVLISEPRVFKDSNKKQRKLVIRLLDRLAISNENDAIFEVLESVLDLDDSAMRIFSDQIKTAKLNNIIQTIERLQKRELAVSRIDEIMRNHYQKTLETPDLQSVIEANTWLFGNQYETIGAEEDTFTVIAKKHRDLVGGIDSIEEHDIDEGATVEGANRQVDLFLVRKQMQFDSATHQPYFKCVIIEIKRPSVALNKKHLRQIEDYAEIIEKSAEFNGARTRYEIILVGRKISGEDTAIKNQLIGHSGMNEPGLVGTGRVKQYVKTWKTIIEEFEIANNFLLSTLQTQIKTIEGTQEELLARLQEPSY